MVNLVWKFWIGKSYEVIQVHSYLQWVRSGFGLWSLHMFHFWQYHQTRQAKTLVVLPLVHDVSFFWGPVELLSERGVSNIWIHSRYFNKLLHFSNLNFAMKGASVKKVIMRVFLQWSHLSFPKISTSTDPPFTFLAYISQIFGKYRMPIFFIEYLGSLRPVRTWLMYIWSKLSKN